MQVFSGALVEKGGSLQLIKLKASRDVSVAREPWRMLNTVHFDPWQRSLFVPSVSSANTKEKGPLLAGNQQHGLETAKYDR